MFEVLVPARSVEPFAEIVGVDRIRALERLAADLRATVGEREIWNVNTAASGGGVAEMLRSFLRYSRGLGVDVRWLVFQGPPDFFRVTKRVHNALHGARGDGSPMGPEQAALYDRVTRENAVAIDALVRPGDLVICHDPQTAGLVPHLLARGVSVVWRCHIGHERHEAEVDRAWGFLRPYIEDVPLAVFSRAAYAPAWLRRTRVLEIPPTIDPFSAKNRAMDAATRRAILATVGLVDSAPGPAAPAFVRDDGSQSRVVHGASVVRAGRPPSLETPLVVQVSRWDAIKDPRGVLDGFVRFRGANSAGRAELVLAGPDVKAVADDPEGARVFADLQDAWLMLPAALRDSVHLAMLPMDDEEENAAIVNALQRHAAVIVQKSLQEGFGLTVTEAMWKRRPVIASAVGGIQDQIRDGIDGALVHNPSDLDEFAGLLTAILGSEDLAHRLGNAAYDRVRDRYLSTNALEHWAALLGTMVTRP